jgi:hypothetical protein
VPHPDALVFILSTFVIMHAWFYHPTALSPSYRHWITQMAAIDPRISLLLRHLKDGTVAYGRGPSGYLEGYCRDHHVDPADADFAVIPRLPCHVIHPLDATCAGNFARRSARGFVGALALYLPIHAIAQLLVRRKEVGAIVFGESVAAAAAGAAAGAAGGDAEAVRAAFTSTLSPTYAGAGAGAGAGQTEDLIAGTAAPLARPRRSWGVLPLSRSTSAPATATATAKLLYLLRLFARAATAAVRSSAFLGLFIGLTWGGVCAARQLGPRDPSEQSGPLLGSLLGGLSIFVENPHRRAELATYVAPRALQTLWHRLEAQGLVRSIPGAHVSIFSLAAALLMGCYELSRGGGDEGGGGAAEKEEEERIGEGGEGNGMEHGGGAALTAGAETSAQSVLSPAERIDGKDGLPPTAANPVSPATTTTDDAGDGAALAVGGREGTSASAYGPASSSTSQPSLALSSAFSTSPSFQPATESAPVAVAVAAEAGVGAGTGVSEGSRTGPATSTGSPPLPPRTAAAHAVRRLPFSPTLAAIIELFIS